MTKPFLQLTQSMIGTPPAWEGPSDALKPAVAVDCAEKFPFLLKTPCVVPSTVTPLGNPARIFAAYPIINSKLDLPEDFDAQIKACSTDECRQELAAQIISRVQQWTREYSQSESDKTREILRDKTCRAVEAFYRMHPHAPNLEYLLKAYESVGADPLTLRKQNDVFKFERTARRLMVLVRETHLDSENERLSQMALLHRLIGDNQMAVSLYDQLLDKLENSPFTDPVDHLKELIRVLHDRSALSETKFKYLRKAAEVTVQLMALSREEGIGLWIENRWLQMEEEITQIESGSDYQLAAFQSGVSGETVQKQLPRVTYVYRSFARSLESKFDGADWNAEAKGQLAERIVEARYRAALQSELVVQKLAIFERVKWFVGNDYIRQQEEEWERYFAAVDKFSDFLSPQALQKVKRRAGLKTAEVNLVIPEPVAPDEPSLGAALRTAIAQLGKDSHRMTLAWGAGALAMGALTLASGGTIPALAAIGAAGLNAVLAERAFTVWSGRDEIEASYQTGISSLTTIDALHQSAVFATNMLGMYYGGRLGGLAQSATQVYSRKMGLSVAKMFLESGMKLGSTASSIGSVGLWAASTAANAAVFHNATGLMNAVLWDAPVDHSFDAYFRSWLFVSIMPAVEAANPGRSFAAGGALGHKLTRESINTLAGATLLQTVFTGLDGISAYKRTGEFAWDWQGQLSGIAKLGVELPFYRLGSRAFQGTPAINASNRAMRLMEAMRPSLKIGEAPFGSSFGGLVPTMAGGGRVLPMRNPMRNPNTFMEGKVTDRADATLSPKAIEGDGYSKAGGRPVREAPAESLNRAMDQEQSARMQLRRAKREVSEAEQALRERQETHRLRTEKPGINSRLKGRRLLAGAQTKIKWAEAKLQSAREKLQAIQEKFDAALQRLRQLESQAPGTPPIAVRVQAKEPRRDRQFRQIKPAQERETKESAPKREAPQLVKINLNKDKGQKALKDQEPRLKREEEAKRLNSRIHTERKAAIEKACSEAWAAKKRLQEAEKDLSAANAKVKKLERRVRSAEKEFAAAANQIKKLQEQANPGAIGANSLRKQKLRLELADYRIRQNKPDLLVAKEAASTAETSRDQLLSQLKAAQAREALARQMPDAQNAI